MDPRKLGSSPERKRQIKQRGRPHGTRFAPIETRVSQEYTDSADNEREKAEGVDPVRDANQRRVPGRIQNLWVLNREPCDVSRRRHCWCAESSTRKCGRQQRPGVGWSRQERTLLCLLPVPVCTEIVLNALPNSSKWPYSRRFRCGPTCLWNTGFSLDQPHHAELRITLQKLPRWKLGSLSASTSAFTFPKVVSGLCLMPS